MTELLNGNELNEKVQPAEAAGVFQVALEMRGKFAPGQNLFERGLALVESLQEENPAGSLVILEAVEPAAAKPADVIPTKQKLLERLVKDKPNDVELVSRLAVVYERTGKGDRCLPMLEPLAGQLGTSEGARILGLSYFKKGKHEQAYGLLQPYADFHLKALHAAEEQVERIENAARERLKNGKATDFNYQLANTAPKEQQQKMVSEYLSRALLANPEGKRLLDTLLRENAVVPVALDLGLMQLERAQRMANPGERKKELERAEKTLLAVRGMVGEQAQFKLRLGQVYYWMGRQAEGRKLFDEALQASNRSFELLMGVSSLLRELGAAEEARTLAEEAYKQQGIEQAKKEAAALRRALTSKDLDDEILWLERANPNHLEVKASLAQARGHKALNEGKDDESAKQFREAANLYGSLQETATTLNNAGLAWLDRYRAAGDRADLTKGVAMLEKAVELNQRDGILAGNVASIVLSLGIAEVVGDQLDLGKLRRMGDAGVLPYLYSDNAGRQALARKLSENATITRARRMLERALLLAPNNTSLYTQLEGLLSFLEDPKGLTQLAEKAGKAKPDLSAARQQYQDFWAGKNDEKLRKEGQSAVTRYERLVDATRPTGGPTFALTVASLVQTWVGLEGLGLDIDHTFLVKLAEEAHRLAPSVGTIRTLRSALLARASKTLAAQEPEYRQLADKGLRPIGSQYLIAVALWREGKPRAAAQANDDVKRALALILEENKRFPEDSSEWSWAMLRSAHPEEAARLAEKLKTNKKLRLERTLTSRLSPPVPSQALRECWLLDSAGKTAEGLEVLRKAAREGLPLPFEVP